MVRTECYRSIEPIRGEIRLHIVNAVRFVSVISENDSAMKGNQMAISKYNIIARAGVKINCTSMFV